MLAVMDRFQVPRDRFDAKYEALSPLQHGEAGSYRNKPIPVLAKQMLQPFSIARSAGGIRRERITRAFVFSSPMAQYVLDFSNVRSFVDMVDMDSAKWGEYARRRPWPVSAIYKREATRLLAYEREIAAGSEASIFVTREEATLFRDAAPECAAKVATIGNGVDSTYFSPSLEFRSPFASGEHAIVFTGAMDYWPNVDAVSWFARDMLPEIRARDASARFYIVGMNPDSAVRALASDPAVVVTGRVEDVGPFLSTRG
jgi:sugar transferase (PEP-CTERM/EpsH1 system associated)